MRTFSQSLSYRKDKHKSYISRIQGLYTNSVANNYSETIYIQVVHRAMEISAIIPADHPNVQDTL